MTNSVDPDEPSHLVLHCLRRYLCWSAGMNWLTLMVVYFQNMNKALKFLVTMICFSIIACLLSYLLSRRSVVSLWVLGRIMLNSIYFIMSKL